MDGNLSNSIANYVKNLHSNFNVVNKLLDGLLIGFLISVYYLLLSNWFIFITHLFFVPQIIHNAIRGQTCGCDHFYLFYFLGARIFIPVLNNSINNQ